MNVVGTERTVSYLKYDALMFTTSAMSAVMNSCFRSASFILVMCPKVA